MVEGQVTLCIAGIPLTVGADKCCRCDGAWHLSAIALHGARLARLWQRMREGSRCTKRRVVTKTPRCRSHGAIDDEAAWEHTVAAMVAEAW